LLTCTTIKTVNFINQIKMTRFKFLVCTLSILIFSTLANAQALKVTAGNTIMGTASGTMIGLGVMGLQNTNNFTPVRIGIGAGTIFGLGVGIYDVAQMGDFGYYSVEGLFNSTEYSGLIILMDTFYGGVTGSVLGMAVSLMTNDSVINGIQYGGSLGILGGFAFGLVDAFYFSSSTGTFASLQKPTNQVDGLIHVTAKNLDIGLIHPVVYSQISYNSGLGFTTNSLQTGLQVAHLKINF